jgi:NAD(P)H-dependent flavin oxidoreductase YrpB (nitropropane dioxygenase family)
MSDSNQPVMTLQELLDIELPIIQAPMAGVQTSALAVAVSHAGGLGSLPTALLGRASLEDELRLVAAQTDRPYNLNVFCHAEPARDQHVERTWRRVRRRDRRAAIFHRSGAARMPPAVERSRPPNSPVDSPMLSRHRQRRGEHSPISTPFRLAADRVISSGWLLMTTRPAGST